jgi:hypothetical protein
MDGNDEHIDSYPLIGLCWFLMAVSNKITQVTIYWIVYESCPAHRKSVNPLLTTATILAPTEDH